MSIIDVIDQLEGLVAGGKRVVFTPSVMVNEDEALELIDRARLELPDDIKQARWTLEERERLLSAAQHEAEETLAAAREEAERVVETAGEEAERIERAATEHARAMVDGHAVLRQAEERADRMLREAEDRAAAVRAAADAYARDVMEQLEANLVRTVATVRKGIEALVEAAPEPEVAVAHRR